MSFVSMAESSPSSSSPSRLSEKWNNLHKQVNDKRAIEFQNEHLRLMGALVESNERQSLLHKQVRGLKERLINCGLRVMVANRMAEEDGQTMVQLRDLAQESKRRSIDDEKKTHAASDLILNLNNEILNLKKLLRDGGFETKAPTFVSWKDGVISKEEADDEVDAITRRYESPDSIPALSIMYPPFSDERVYQEGPATVDDPRFASYNQGVGIVSGLGGFTTTRRPATAGNQRTYAGSFASASRTGATSAGSDTGKRVGTGTVPGTETPFITWKTDHLIWTPDGPGGSEFCDFQGLEQAARKKRPSSGVPGTRAKVYDTTALRDTIASGSKKSTHLPSVQLAMERKALASVSSGANRAQSQTQMQQHGSGYVTTTVPGAVGSDAKPASKYDWDRSKFAVKEVGKGDIDRGINENVPSKLFAYTQTQRGLAL